MSVIKPMIIKKVIIGKLKPEEAKALPKLDTITKTYLQSDYVDVDINGCTLFAPLIAYCSNTNKEATTQDIKELYAMSRTSGRVLNNGWMEAAGVTTVGARARKKYNCKTFIRTVMLDAISTKELFAKNYAISGSISMSSDYFTDIMDGVVDGNLYGHTLGHAITLVGLDGEIYILDNGLGSKIKVKIGWEKLQQLIKAGNIVATGYIVTDQ